MVAAAQAAQPSGQVALTFDDGPHKELTPKLLDILSAESVPATFFVLGQSAEAHGEILKQMQTGGHEIANHSWGHPAFTKISQDRVRQELSKTSRVIEALTGSAPMLMRPPYGALNHKVRDTIRAEGLEIVLWDVDPQDWKKPGPEEITRRVLESAKDGNIILLHDIHPGTVAAVPSIIRGLRNKGFEFVTTSELLRTRTYTAEPAAKAYGTDTSQQALTGRTSH